MQIVGTDFDREISPQIGRKSRKTGNNPIPRRPTSKSRFWVWLSDTRFYFTCSIVKNSDWNCSQGAWRPHSIGNSFPTSVPPEIPSKCRFYLLVSSSQITAPQVLQVFRHIRCIRLEYLGWVHFSTFAWQLSARSWQIPKNLRKWQWALGRKSDL